MGLINCVVPPESLQETVDEWASRLAVAPTRTIALTKKLINDAHDLDRAAAFVQEAWAQEQNMTTHDAQEGVRAFLAKRKPVWKAK